MTQNNLIIGKNPDFSRPVLFLDFDDVLNIFDERVNDPDSDVELYPITVSKGELNPYGVAITQDKKMVLAVVPEIVKRVGQLNAVWLTSWKQLTQKILNEVLGFDFGYVDWYYRGMSDTGTYGKMLAIDEVVANYGIKKFAVVDDKFHHGFKNIIEEKHSNCEVLVIAPDYNTGLTYPELEELEEFMAS